MEAEFWNSPNGGHPRAWAQREQYSGGDKGCAELFKENGRRVMRGGNGSNYVTFYSRRQKRNGAVAGGNV